MSDETNNEAGSDSTTQSDEKSLNLTGIKANDLDLFGAGKLGTKIFNSFENAFSGVTKPWQIRRIASAEADAKIIHAEADAAVRAIENRPQYGIDAIHHQQMKNLEQIAHRASQQTQDKVSNEEVEVDWMMRFVDDCKNVSDEQVQELWARLLAGEVAQPGTFSKRTIGIVKDLSRAEARSFNNLCQLGFRNHPNELKLVIPDYQWPPFEDLRLSYNKIVDLKSLGLIETVSNHHFDVAASIKRGDTLLMHDDFGTLRMSPIKHNYYNQGPVDVPLGIVQLTKFGQELATVVERKVNKLFIQHIISYYATKNIACEYVRK